MNSNDGTNMEKVDIEGGNTTQEEIDVDKEKLGNDDSDNNDDDDNDNDDDDDKTEEVDASSDYIEETSVKSETNNNDFVDIDQTPSSKAPSDDPPNAIEISTDNIEHLEESIAKASTDDGTAASMKETMALAGTSTSNTATKTTAASTMTITATKATTANTNQIAKRNGSNTVEINQESIPDDSKAEHRRTKEEARLQPGAVAVCSGIHVASMSLSPHGEQASLNLMDTKHTIATTNRPTPPDTTTPFSQEEPTIIHTSSPSDELGTNLHPNVNQNNHELSQESHSSRDHQPEQAIREQEQQSQSQASSTTIPMVQAELVQAPVTAYQVTIDEEVRDCNGVNAQRMVPLEVHDGDACIDETDQNRKVFFPWARYATCILLVILLVIVLGISLPVAIVQKIDSEENNSSPTWASPTAPVSITIMPSFAPVVVTTFDYECYTSTYDLMQAQLETPAITDTFVICPNTKIKIGVFRNPSLNDYTVVDGDYPLWLMRPNVTIQCGLDGLSSNNCTMDSGFIQVLTQTVVPMPNDVYFYINTTIDNTTIRGFTFTGIMQTTGPFQGSSVIISHAGDNIRFEDCAWKDITAQYGLIGVGENLYQTAIAETPVEPQTIDVTLSNCRFENIIFDQPLLFADQHSLTVQNCYFENIFPSRVPDRRCGYGFTNGCGAWLVCSPLSSCTVDTVCINSMNYFGPALVVFGNGTNWSFSDIYASNIHRTTFPNDSDNDNIMESQAEQQCIMAFAEFQLDHSEGSSECWDDYALSPGHEIETNATCPFLF